ncbi:MAG: hypothetical protein ACRD8A_06865 [Candidatus Acidiferrales bacterium]
MAERKRLPKWSNEGGLFDVEAATAALSPTPVSNSASGAQPSTTGNPASGATQHQQQLTDTPAVEVRSPSEHERQLSISSNSRIPPGS